MNLENSIKDVISKKLEDGTVEKLVEEHLEKGVSKALESLFSSYGDVTKVIEEKVKSVMVPYLEGYDYSDFITKLDTVLVEILQSSTIENKKLLGNFKALMMDDGQESIKVSELFDHYIKYVSREVDTDDLEVNYDDGVSYEPVSVEFDVQHDVKYDWSSFKYANLVFTCDHDEEHMNFALQLSKYDHDREEGWEVRYDREPSIKSLRYLNEFELLLIRLSQHDTRIILDDESDSEEVTPEKEPEASFS